MGLVHGDTPFPRGGWSSSKLSVCAGVSVDVAVSMEANMGSVPEGRNQDGNSPCGCSGRCKRRGLWLNPHGETVLGRLESELSRFHPHREAVGGILSLSPPALLKRATTTLCRGSAVPAGQGPVFLCLQPTPGASGKALAPNPRSFVCSSPWKGQSS